jgi:hypothetical protein
MRQVWVVMDHKKHPHGWLEMNSGDFRERVKGLRRVPSGDGGELYMGADGRVEVEAYPPRQPVAVPANLGVCYECRSTVDAEELRDGRGLCKACGKLPSRLSRYER